MLTGKTNSNYRQNTSNVKLLLWFPGLLKLFFFVLDNFVHTSNEIWSYLLTAVIGGMNLGEEGLKMRQTIVACSSKVYSERWAVYALRAKKSHMSLVFNHTDMSHMAKTYLP